jgi:O-succinylbenzoic acid--CoA ligase
MFDVDFDFPGPQLICHPSLRKFEDDILEKLNPFFLRDHFILFSSGTTGGDLKGYAISKKALFSNAQAVNNHFGLNQSDVWGLSLPIYHIGGLSVLARAHLLKNKVLDLRRWDADRWMKNLDGVTITTIVPTQLYDLVRKGYRSTPELKFLIVGGDFLSSALKEEAIKLGWPVIRTFGMSEVSSQLASSRSSDSDKLEILPIHQVKLDGETLLVKSPALFTLEFIHGVNFRVNTLRELSDDGYYRTQDRAELDGNILIPKGRLNEEIKVGGHLVNLNLLRDTLGTFLIKRNLFGKIELIVQDDERKGKKLALLALEEVRSLEDELKALFIPVKIDEVRYVRKFERTDLGKLKF